MSLIYKLMLVMRMQNYDDETIQCLIEHCRRNKNTYKQRGIYEHSAIKAICEMFNVEVVPPDLLYEHIREAHARVCNTKAASSGIDLLG